MYLTSQQIKVTLLVAWCHSAVAVPHLHLHTRAFLQFSPVLCVGVKKLGAD